MMQTFIWSEDSDYAAFRLSVRNFLARQTELNTVREREERRGPYDRGLWQQFCETFELADLMAVPRTGGSPDYRALSIIAEEGPFAFTLPSFLSTIALAVPLACLFNSSGQLDSLIEDMVIGKVVVSVAFQETALELSIPDDIHATFREEAGRYFISGRKISVLDGGGTNAGADVA
ncbi:MAG: hypothetical protein HIU84_14685 [Acidobacteria bacterium]|nr:hypothetical protein [Acidobacteriota bacterium]